MTSVLLGGVPGASRAQQEIFLDAPICDSNLGASASDDFHDIDIDSNRASVAVSVSAFEPLNQSGFAEFTRTFTPILSMPATVTYGAVTFFGELVGFGGTGAIEGSVEIRVTLRDETQGVDIGTQVLLDESEDGGFFTQITQQVDSDVAPPIATFNGVQLVRGRTYSITGRIEVRAQGLGASADFSIAPTDFGCLTATSELIDSDGDGLFDTWEQNGVDVDDDGDIDVPLHTYGADPMHKDLFIEYDWVTGFAPTRNDIQNVRDAFDTAPVGAGGVSNPDGADGITFWIDTGTAQDPTASEDGSGAGTCGDGLDNGLDGLTDGADPDCLSGNDLGGGNALPNPVNDLDASFYAAKNGSPGFTPERRGLFRYGIQGNPADAPPGLGGRAELGGDDFVVFNRLPGSLFHEIGHTLNLSHGGAPGETNCKPNYVSVMNYHHQLGLRITGATGGQDLDGDGTPDGRYLDFSPTVIPGGRPQAPLATLDETDLDDGVVLDPTDPVNQFAFVDASGVLVRVPVDMPVDWNSNRDLTELNQMFDIDIDGPSSCSANAGLTADPPGLVGYDDWSNIRLQVLADGDLEDAALNAVLEPEPDEEALFALERQFNSTDVRAVKSDTPDPVEVGDPITYTVIASDEGPNPASRVLVTDTLPANTTLVSTSPTCAEGLVGTVVCDLGELLVGEQAEVQIQVDTDDVCVDGLPPTLTNLATVSNEPNFAGVDPDPSNDDASEQTTAVDTTPPEITDLSIAPESLWPPNHKMRPIEVSVTAVDICDPNPVCTLVSITSDEPTDGTGDGNTSPDWVITGELTANLRAERSGDGDGRTFTLTVECSDASGNSVSGETFVTVAHDRGK